MYREHEQWISNDKNVQKDQNNKQHDPNRYPKVETIPPLNYNTDVDIIYERWKETLKRSGKVQKQTSRVPQHTELSTYIIPRAASGRLALSATRLALYKRQSDIRNNT